MARDSRRRSRRSDSIRSAISGTGPSPMAGWAPRRSTTILEKTDLRTGLILFMIFVLALFVRSYFNAEPAQEDGYQLTGGSDPYYHKRVSDYVIDEGVHLKKDQMLNFPVGGTNNRPPVFDWSMSIIGTAFSPFNGGDVEDTTWKAFLFMPALWGAFTIFPVYFIGRAQFGRGAGIWAALLFGMMSGHISHTTLALADHDAYILFFTSVAFYFFMRALMVGQEGKWVSNWMDTRSIQDGFRNYVDHNREALGYAGLAGMAIAAVALAWKGFPYLIFIIFGYAVVQLLVNMFQGKDSMAVSVVVAITMGLPLILSLPYYYSMNFVDMWWTAPFYIFLATLVVIAVLLPTRDLPWTMVLTSTVLVALVSYGMLKYLFVDVGEQLFSGQGYFLRTKLFDTIAEAQPPRFPVFVFAYGVATTWLTLVGAAYMVYLIYQQRQWKADYMFVLVWAITSIYMARSAVRFIYNATPVFALLAGWVVWLIVKWADFPGWWTNLRRHSGGGYEVGFRQYSRDKIQGLWKATEWKHPTVAVAIGLLVIGANGIQAVDAGIPYETKKENDVWIWEHIPFEGILKREEYNYSQRQNTTIYPDGVNSMYNRTSSDDLRYLGITGPSFPSDYWIEGLRWLATQDNELPQEQRPAFISWWDYGFWAIDIGEHPTVADNFQWGYQLAGNFIAAQSEEEAIALLLYRLLQAERSSAKKDPDRPFNSETRVIMEKYFTSEEVDEIEDLMADPESYAKEGVDKKNAAIRAVRPILMQLDMEDLADLLTMVEKSSGNSIRYFAVDQRLMPFSWDNTGILYAPVTLADYDISDFIEVLFVTENGEQLTADEASAEAEKDPNFQVVDRTLVYKDRFFNSMFYKAFIGWYGEDIGGTIEDGIPGINGQLASTQLNRMPGWNLSHFKLVNAIPGLTMLKYYDGAKISGQVRTTDGTPVPNSRVTLLDVDPQFGTIPHGSTFTDEYGYYQMDAVAGNLTIMVSQGPLESEQEMLYQTSNNVLTQERGFRITEAQATRLGGWEIAHDIKVDPASFQGTVYWDLNGDQTYSDDSDKALAGVPVILTHNLTGHQTITQTIENGSYELDNVAPGEYRLNIVYNDHEIELAQYLGAAGVKADQALTVDGVLVPNRITGKIEFKQLEPQNVTLSLTDHLNGEVQYTTGITSFSFDRLLEGNYTLKVENDDLASQLPANQVTVTLVAGDPLNQSLVIQPGLAISGTIRLGGKGLADQGIDYVNMDGGVEGQVISDEAGNFAVVVPQGRYSFYSIYQEEQTANSYLTKVDTATFTGTLNINLRQSSKVTGFLFYDDNGNGVLDVEQEQTEGGQEITFFSTQGAMTKSIVSEGGKYSIYLPVGQYSAYAMVQRPGEAGIEPYASLMTVQISIAERELNLGLRPAHDLVGSLVEGTGASAKNINGTLIATSARGTVLQPAIWGEFILGLPSDTYTLDIDIYGYEIEKPIEVDLSSPKELKIQVIPLDISLNGKVTWKEQPLIGATVALMPFDHPEETVQEDVSQAGGYYSIDAPPGHYLVQVEKLEGNDRFTALTDIILPLGGGTVDLDLSTDLRLRVAGKVFDGQDTVSGTLVFTLAELPGQTYRVETKPTEGYEVYVPRGNYYVTFDDGSSSDHLSLLQTIDVDTSMNHDIALNSGDRWAGSVVNSVDLDRLDEKVELTLHGATGTIFITTEVDAKLKVDLPAGIYTVEVDHPGYQTYTGSLTILAGKNTRTEIPLEPEPVSIAGRLTYETPNGTTEGLALTPITFKIDNSESDLNYVVTTNDTGYYQLDELLPGRYDFIVDHTLADGSVRYQLENVKTIKAGDPEQTYNRKLNAEYHLYGQAYYDRNYNQQVDEGEVLVDTKIDIWNDKGTSLVKSLKVDENGAFSHYRVDGDYLLLAHGTTPGGASMVSSQTIQLDQAVETDQLLQRGVTMNATLVHNDKAVKIQELIVTGPVTLSLAPENGNVLTALPSGDYHLRVDHEDNSGTPDFYYYLDHNLTLTTSDDRVPLELELEKYQSHGMKVVALSDLRTSTIVGSEVNFSFNVTNTGHFEDVFSLTLSEVPANWTIDLELGEEFTIKSGETRKINITVTPDVTVIPRVFMNLEANFSWSNDRDDDIDDLYEVFDLRVTPIQRPRPNFHVSTLSVSGDRIEGITLTITAAIASTALDSGTHTVSVQFMVDNEPLGDPFSIELEPDQAELVTATWKASREGSYTIKVEVDPDNEVAETDENDNTYSLTESIEKESDGGWLENRWLAAGITGLILVLVVIILVMTNNIRRRSSTYGGYRKRR